MSAEDILSKPPPPPDQRVAYGSDPHQFLEARLPKGKARPRALMNIHGGYWRAKYDLAHAGHLCEALRAVGFATFNIEYRRVGDEGGGWPGTFSDIRSAYQFLRQQHSQFGFDPKHLAVMGHSAGGQLALCLAAHEPSLRSAVSLAGVLDLKRAYTLHLSNDAVVEFLGGTPGQVPDHYREADPMQLHIPHARQWVLHGKQDDTVPLDFSSHYATSKAKRGEHVELVEVAKAGHFELIDPGSEAFHPVRAAVIAACG